MGSMDVVAIVLLQVLTIIQLALISRDIKQLKEKNRD